MIEGDWSGRVTGLRDQRVEIAMMRMPDGHGRIELSRFLTPPPVADHRNAPVNALGYLRVMFAVDDLDDTLARLREHGAQLVDEVVDYEGVYRLCYVRGPEGIPSGWPSKSADAKRAPGRPSRILADAEASAFKLSIPLPPPRSIPKAGAGDRSSAGRMQRRTGRGATVSRRVTRGRKKHLVTVSYKASAIARPRSSRKLRATLRNAGAAHVVRHLELIRSGEPCRACAHDGPEPPGKHARRNS